MKYKEINLFLVVALVWSLTSLPCQAQTRDKIPYYINLNNIAEGTIHEISDQQLHIEYNDAYGTAKEFLFKIYDWKRHIVANLQMDKSLGINNYTINLDDLYSGWELDKIYMGELKNEEGAIYKLPLRIVSPPKMKDPVVDIVVNPVQVGCDDLSPSLVEFYGNITGGKAPYTVNWYVLNNSRTDFLYQPKEEIIALAGKTSLVRVDKNPEYYVVLYVKDACGNEQKKIVNLVCGDSRKKINSVFLEELNSPLFKSRNSIK